MSADVRLIFDHALDAAAVAALPERLHPQAFPAFTPAYERLIVATGNRVEESDVDVGWRFHIPFQPGVRDPEIAWSGEKFGVYLRKQHLHIAIGRRSCVLGIGCHWGWFLDDERLQAATHLCYEALAPILGATTLLYVPNEGCPSRAIAGALNGEDIASIQQDLRANCGPPVSLETAAAALSDRSRSLDIRSYYLLHPPRRG